MYLLAEALPFVRRVRIPISRDQAMLLLAAVNLIVLGLDTFLAHSASGSLRGYLWIPILFSPIAGLLLLVAGLIALRRRPLAELIGSLIFLATILVALFGSYFHLNRALLPDAPAGQAITALLLIYAPPLLSPLTFGLVAILGLSAAWEEDPVDSGVLRLLGRLRLRMPYPKTQAYFFMTALFMLATVLSSVLDHARTNFNNPWQWLPTAVGVFATVVTFAMGAFPRPTRSDLWTYLAAMGLMILVGLVGAVLHLELNLTSQGLFLEERFLRGAPMLAPLLFSNMGLLGIIVLLEPKKGI